MSRQTTDFRLLTRRQFVAAGAGVLLSAPAIVRAQSSAADFYRGKTVRLLVGSPPGGGYDIYARLVTPALATKLGATVLVENKGGNGGLAALGTLMVRPADGLTIMCGSAEAAILSQMLERPGVSWDVTKLNWLAKMASAPKLWFVGKDPRVSDHRRRHEGQSAHLVGDGPGRRHQRRASRHLLRDWAEVKDRHRLSAAPATCRSPLYVMKSIPVCYLRIPPWHTSIQSSRLRCSVPSAGRICQMCRPCARPR